MDQQLGLWKFEAQLLFDPVDDIVSLLNGVVAGEVHMKLNKIDSAAGPRAQIVQAGEFRMARCDLDEAAGLTTSGAMGLFDFRTGSNIQHSMKALLRQSVYTA